MTSAELVQQLPRGFVLGAATAAYQIEGAWDEDGKGESVWDRFCHATRRVRRGETGDVACDHYHRYEDDLKLMSEIGLGGYRFSISWPRIMPNGVGAVNEKGVDFYRRLLDGLRERGITPLVTLFHWDLPQALQEKGGWNNPECVDWFADYAEEVLTRLGDRISHVITINEILSYAGLGNLLGVHAPGVRSPRKTVRVMHHMMLGHARAYERIKALRPACQVGISHILYPVMPLRERDASVARRGNQFSIGPYLLPLTQGRYPEPWLRVMRLVLAGVEPDEISVLKGTMDFLGINHYSRLLVRRAPVPIVRFLPARPPGNPEYTAMNWEVCPEGFARLLQIVRDDYGNPPVYVTENGASYDDVMGPNGVDDPERRAYIAEYLGVVARSIRDGSDIRGYFVWTLMDNFEWAFGFEKRFGIVYTDFQTQRRSLKQSGVFYRELCQGIANRAMK